MRSTMRSPVEYSLTYGHPDEDPDNASVAGINGTRNGAVSGLTTITLPLVTLGGLAARYIAYATANPASSTVRTPCGLNHRSR